MVISGAAGAQSGSSLEHVETATVETADHATTWGLSEKEWDQYRQVMQNRRGVWSPGLDPITADAINDLMSYIGSTIDSST